MTACSHGRVKAAPIHSKQNLCDPTSGPKITGTLSSQQNSSSIGHGTTVSSSSPSAWSSQWTSSSSEENEKFENSHRGRSIWGTHNSHWEVTINHQFPSGHWSTRDLSMAIFNHRKVGPPAVGDKVNEHLNISKLIIWQLWSTFTKTCSTVPL
jgi:hypothetical protein